MAEATTLTSWAAAIATALKARGVDADSLLVRAGLDPALIDQAGARYPTRAMTRFWELAVAATEPSLSLEVPRYVRPATMNALGASLGVSRTLGDALLRMARYSRLVTDAADIALELDGPRANVVYRVPVTDLPLANAAYEAFMATAVGLSRLMTGHSRGLLACEFRHPAPVDPSPYQRFFGCEVRFQQARNRLVFDAATLAAPLPGADDAVARRYDTAAAEYLARFDAQPMAQRVRELLIRQLPSGEPTRAAIAAALHLTPRTLLRRLAAEHTHWKALLNEVRRELALSYLRQGRSAAEITYLLGFGNPSNFTRAFHRWAQQSPSGWRRANRVSSAPDNPGRAGSS